MTDLLNPMHPKNPQQQISETNKKNTKTEKYVENKEGIFLPSRGLFYLGELKGIEYLKVRPLNYTDEDILTTESYYVNGTLFDELLNNVIIDENGLKARDLVPIDRDTILIWLRASAFGKEMEIQYTCSQCGGGSGNKSKLEPGIIKWDLTEIDIPSYDEETFEKLKNDGCITIETPLKNIKVKISVPSIGTTNSIDKSYKQKKKNEKSTKDFFATQTLLSVVQGVEVEENKFVYSKMDIDAFFRKIELPLSESRYILREANKLNLKYNTAKTFVCKDCGHTEEGVELPMLHKNFFWPEL